MPLEHSSSAAAFKRNASTLLGEVGKSPHVKSRAQALAIAYETQRRSRAFGGQVRGYDDGGAVQAVLNALQAGSGGGGGAASPTGMMPPATPPTSPQWTNPTPATNPPAPTGIMGTAPQGGQGTVQPTGMMNTAPQNNGVSPTGMMPPANNVQPTGMMGLAPQGGVTPSGMMPPASGGSVAPTGMMGLAPDGGVVPSNASTPPALMSNRLMNTGGVVHRAEGGFNVAKSPHLMGEGWQTRNEAHGMMKGPILSAVPGRTDNHFTKVASNSYVLPAQTIAGMGQGNSVAGLAAAHSIFGPSGPYGAGASMKMGHGSLPKPPKPMKFADGGYSEGGARVGNEGHIPVDVALAGGEYIIEPEVVRAIGDGNMKNGHKVLDAFVMHHRKKDIKIQQNLKPPAKK